MTLALSRRLAMFRDALDADPDHHDPEGALASVVFSSFVWESNEQRHEAQLAIEQIVEAHRSRLR